MCAVTRCLPRHENARERIICECYEWVLFIIFESDVVAGEMLLDEVAFENQCFFFCGYDNIIKAGDFADEFSCFGIFGAIGKVGAHSVFQVFGFAHIDDFVIGVFHDVTAGFAGEK